MNISKRNFLRLAVCTPVIASLSRTAEASALFNIPLQTQTPAAPTGPFTLPPLTYPFNALEPHIDAQTMQLHHDRHHQAFITNLNALAAKQPEIGRRTPEDLARNLARLPEDIRTTVRNNAGGHLNHTMFWRIMKPRGGGEPTGEVARVIRDTFGGFDKFKMQFDDAGAKRFGSGWVWLVRDRRTFRITTTANQDNPLMEGLFPVMGNDVWEHAYYLKYNNRRADYLKAWWNTVNWDEINNRLRMA